MKSINLFVMAGCLAASSAFAADNMKKGDMMSKDAMPHMTMQECKDHMAVSGKAGMKKDDAMMKKDATCADMMKKDDGMMNKNGGMMKPGPMASQPK